VQYTRPALQEQEVQGAEGRLQESPSCRSSPTCGPQEVDVLEEEELEKQGEQEGQQVSGRREGWEQVVGGQSRGQQSTSPCRHSHSMH